MRILVIEDERDLAQAIAVGLRRERYAVDIALNGAMARERLDINRAPNSPCGCRPPAMPI